MEVSYHNPRCRYLYCIHPGRTRVILRLTPSFGMSRICPRPDCGILHPTPESNTASGPISRHSTLPTSNIRWTVRSSCWHHQSWQRNLASTCRTRPKCTLSIFSPVQSSLVSSRYRLQSKLDTHHTFVPRDLSLLLSSTNFARSAWPCRFLPLNIRSSTCIRKILTFRS